MILGAINEVAINESPLGGFLLSGGGATLTKITKTYIFNYALAVPTAPSAITRSDTCPYSLLINVVVRATTTFPYTDLKHVAASIALPYGELPYFATSITFPYADLKPISKSTTFLYSDLPPLAFTTTFPWGIRQALDMDFAFYYDVCDSDKLTKTTYFNYAIAGNFTTSIESNPKLYDSANNEIDFVSIRLSCDENSPYFIADVVLSEVSDFLRLSIKDALKLVFISQTFNFVVDGRNQSRTEGKQDYTISLISPAALLDNPYAATIDKVYTTAQMASVVVCEVVNAIDWQLYDWLVPVEQLQFVSTTPMTIAKTIVNAIAGVLESTPAGTLVARKKYKVSIPDYAASNVVHGFNDDALISVSESISPAKLFNRVDIYSTQLVNNSIQDRLEYKVDEVDPLSGVMEGYPSPWRAVTLTHTGNPLTQIMPLGVASRTETEEIEFVAGKANTKYPIDSILTMEWDVVNLGAVTYAGALLTSSILAESLLKISYTVRSYSWQIRGIDKTEVQFLCMD